MGPNWNANALKPLVEACQLEQTHTGLGATNPSHRLIVVVVTNMSRLPDTPEWTR
jgi:hypothetical protein